MNKLQQDDISALSGGHNALMKTEWNRIETCFSSTKDKGTVIEQSEMSTITDASSCGSTNEVTPVPTTSCKRKCEEDLKQSIAYHRLPKKRFVRASMVPRESSPRNPSENTEDSDTIFTRFTCSSQVSPKEIAKDQQAKQKSERRCDLVMAAASALTDLTSSSRSESAGGGDNNPIGGDDHQTTIPKEISTDSTPSKRILDKRTLRFPVKVSTLLILRNI